VVVVTPSTASLPVWVVLGSKLFLRDLEKITPRIVTGAVLVVDRFVRQLNSGR